MIEIEIIGVRKDNGNHYNPHEACTHYRWRQGDKGVISTRQEVVGWVDNGIDGTAVRAYVAQAQPTVDCYVNESPAGTRFLQTKADDTSANNLLNLPEC